VVGVPESLIEPVLFEKVHQDGTSPVIQSQSPFASEKVLFGSVNDHF